jgi:ceramide glucosyltransferase
MTKFLLGLSLVGLLTSSAFGVLVLAGIRRFVLRRRIPARSFLQPVSLFKPLHGDEPNLEAHLETFFQQDYPAFEILFGARVTSDPALQTARRVAARYPRIPVKFVLTGEPWHINAKVCTLERMEQAAAHDIFVISDSDVRVAPNYIREVVSPFSRSEVGAVTCLYRGVADRGLWSKLEAAGMSIEMTAGVLVADLMEGVQFALGPTMAVRRACMQAMGGFGSLGAYCADDFLLGNRVHAAGNVVVLSTHVIDHLVLNASFLDSQRHQIRWMKSTRFSRPRGHLATCLTFSVPFGLMGMLAALLLQHPALGAALLVYSVVTRTLMAAAIGKLVVREKHLLRAALLFPVRDLLGFFYWAASYTSNRIVWRNQIYALAAGGYMMATEPQVEAKSAPAFTA